MIAIVVGVAALSVMMTIIDDVGTVGEEELSANPNHEVLSNNIKYPIGVTVTDEDGQGIPNATVYLQSGTANLDKSDTTFTETDYNGSTNTLNINPKTDIDWRPGQESGEIEIHIKPPGDGNYKDDQIDKITVLNPNA
ncbi:putative pilin/flagellin [Halapricum desulfuricans]|uniref:Putative pilin/flagellin n=1 Tax=Halapricum desulfuricans TaxID=2841257 RepID=A0A897N2Y9_9EURY|nr:putative pilin/flagellin [Halapricum desulfuricans]